MTPTTVSAGSRSRQPNTSSRHARATLWRGNTSSPSRTPLHSRTSSAPKKVEQPSERPSRPHGPVSDLAASTRHRRTTVGGRGLSVRQRFHPTHSIHPHGGGHASSPCSLTLHHLFHPTSLYLQPCAHIFTIHAARNTCGLLPPAIIHLRTHSPSVLSGQGSTSLRLCNSDPTWAAISAHFCTRYQFVTISFQKPATAEPFICLRENVALTVKDMDHPQAEITFFNNSDLTSRVPTTVDCE
jgi:hypothetical protein